MAFANQAPQARNGLGVAGFVTGLVGLVFSPIPFVGVVAWPLVIIGLVLSLVGFNRVRKGEATNKGLSISGIAVSAVGLVICILWVVGFGAAVDEANDPVSITYKVSGDADKVTINYSTYGKERTTKEIVVKELPWTKTVEVTSFSESATLTVQAGPEGGKVKCKITIGDQKPTTGVGTGSYATARCSDVGI